MATPELQAPIDHPKGRTTIDENHPTKRYGKTLAVDHPEPLVQRPRTFTWARIAALLVTIVLLAGLTYLRVSSSPGTVSVPQGAHAFEPPLGDGSAHSDHADVCCKSDLDDLDPWDGVIVLILGNYRDLLHKGGSRYEGIQDWYPPAIGT